MKTFMSPLTIEEEKICLKRMEEGDDKAKEELILHNMRLVAHVTKKYQNVEEEAEDLISIGTIGLLKAVDTFNTSFGSKFSTYAIRCIDNELLMYFRSKKKQKQEVSLYEPIGVDKEGNQIHLFDVLENNEKDIALVSEQKDQMNQIKRNFMVLLSPRERFIIEERYGLTGKKERTQREIANQMKISRSYVSRIEKKALEKLRLFLEKT